MSARDRAKWNQNYQAKASAPLPHPDLLLLDYTPAAAESDARALDLAGGRGQNGLWLADQGYTVDIVDISRVALDAARQAMAERGLRNVNLLAVDLDHYVLPPDTYDVACVFRYLNRRLLGDLAQTVKRGGRLIYETFSLQYLDEQPDFNPEFCLLDGELTAAFEGWRVLLSQIDGPTVRFVARKP